MYVKLFGSILDSSIWSADLATRVVWITMLAMADEYGVVNASLSGLARRAQVSERECRRALKLLSSPDKDDRSGVEGGVRIRALQGAWELVNYQKYRELRTKRQVVAAARQARHRSKLQRDEQVIRRDGRDVPVTGVTGHDVTVEAEVEAEAEAKKPSAPTAARPTWLTPFGEAWTAAYGGLPAYGKLAVSLRPLIKAHPAGEVLEHWTRYLETTDGQYASPARFAQTYGQYGKRSREPEGLPDMYLTLEEQAARKAKRIPEGPESVSDILKRVAP